MQPATFSVRNSLFINLVSVLIIIVGIYYWFNMKQEAFPNINFDRVMVTTTYIGATPQEVEKLITIPLEEELTEVDDIKEIVSVSAENFSSIFLEIDPDAKNKNKVVQNIQRAVDRERDLPEDIEDNPLVTELESKNIPVIQVALSGLPQRELRRYADSLKDKFQNIPGVAAINKNGWHDREIHIDVDPAKVSQFYISLAEIITALKNKNLNLPGGTLKTGEQEFLIRTMGEFETPKEIAQVIVRANEEGNWIRVGDISVVHDTFEDDEIIFKTNGEASINLIVVKRESADTIKLVKRVNTVIEEFQQTTPSELHIETFDDISFYVKRRLNVLVNNGLIGIALVVVCLLFFLQARVALLTALGLPIAFCSTLIMMSCFGISINLISMFGMIIVLGMLVDDGIIIAENSYRHIENGMSPKEAAIRGTNEVTKPVVATILTTVAFFAPLFMMSGIMGKYVSNIPQVVILMLGASLIEALFILPSHIADFAKQETHAEKKDRLGDRFFRFLLRYYERIIRFNVKFRYLILCIVLLAVVAAILLNIFFMKFMLFTAEGIEQFTVTVEAPIGTPIEQTSALLKPIEDRIRALPDSELENFVTTVGKAGDDREMTASTTTGSHLAFMYVYLTPESARARDTDAIINSLREQTKNIQGFDKISFEEIRPGPPVGKPIAVQIRGNHFNELHAVSLRVQDYLRTMDGVRDIKDDFTEGKEELRVIIDEEKATRLFLNTRLIAESVRYGFAGGVATVIKTTDEEIDVLVKFPEEAQHSLESFKSIFIPNKSGKLIPLPKVATLKKEKGFSAIRHLDRKRVITVTATVDDDRITSAEVNKLLQKEFKDITKEFIETTITYGGEQKDTTESMKSLAMAFIWGFLIVFLILASTFKSLVQPFVVLTSIPLGLIGVIYVFFIHGQPLGFFAIMGAVGLAGVAVNDAIVLVEFINHLRVTGHTRRESIIEGGKLRLRPVILTTITTVLGLMPVAYGWGGSDPIIKPMALALGWGLFFATFSTLLFIPCLYAIIDDCAEKVKRFTRKEVDLVTKTVAHIRRKDI